MKSAVGTDVLMKQNIIARSSQPQTPTMTPGQSPAAESATTPALKSGGLQTQSLPATPQEGLASRAGRFYSSLNPKLHRVNEQPEPPRIEEQRGRPRAASQSADFAQRRGPMPYTPTAPSLAQRYNPPPPPRNYQPPPVVPSPAFSSPPSVNGRVGHFAGPPRRAHTADLHIRSRSPISYQPDANLSSAIAAADNNSKPASHLGMFHSTAGDISRDGGQQRPWNVSMPRDQTESGVDPTRYPLPRSNMMSPVNPAAADMPPPPPPKIPLQMNDIRETTPAPPSVNTAPRAVELPAPNNSNNNTEVQPAELPTHDDSSEEIVMSSTAYPGQEWQPAYLGHWD